MRKGPMTPDELRDIVHYGLGPVTCPRRDKVSSLADWLQELEDENKPKEHVYKPSVCGVDNWWCHGTCFRHGQCMYVAPGDYE